MSQIGYLTRWYGRYQPRRNANCGGWYVRDTVIGCSASGAFGTRQSAERKARELNKELS